MESTVYRRGEDGQLIGTPQAEQIASVPIVESAESFQQPINADPVETGAPYVSSASTIYNVNEPKRQLHDRIADKFQRSTKVAVEPLKKKKSRFKKLLRIPKLILIAYLVTYIFLFFHATNALNKKNAIGGHLVHSGTGTNWLLVGSDSRLGLSKKEQHVLHTGKDGGAQRTDTIMIVHLDGNKPTMVSLPRDSYVVIPAHTSVDGVKVGDRHDKINASFSYGGAPLLVRTVEKNTGLHIDHYMEVGFAGIRDITDAIGGVDICVPRNYNDKNSNLHVKKGCQTMDGKTALAYVRMRYADPTGDIGRIQRQQQFLGAVMHKAIKPGVFMNPLSLYHLTDAGAAAVRIDKEDGLVDVGKLALGMKNLSNGKGKVQTVPIANPNGYSEVGSVVFWDDKKAAKLFAKLGAR